MPAPQLARRTLCVVAGAMVLAAAWRPAAAAEADDRQRALAAAGAVKIVVRGQGWIRVSQPELRAAGLRADADPAKLQVFADGVEQAIVVTGNGDATFAADEAIELYGVGRDTLSTDARTYWLIAGAAGARVPRITPPPGGVAPTSFVRTARIAERKIYLSAIKNGEPSNFFAAPISATATTVKVAAPRVAAPQAATAKVRVSLQGVTKGPHTVDVSVGGAIAGTCVFADQQAKTCEFTATAAEGDNAVTFVARGGAQDFSALSSVELDYAHTFTAEDDALAFTAPTGARLSIDGFTSQDVRVVDVTDAGHPVELAVQVALQGAASTVSFDTPAGMYARTLLAFTAARVGKAAAVVADAPSRWGDSHDGELVILSHAVFLDAMAPLVARRTQEGWRVQLVDLQDVYDERGGGDKSVAAVRAFLQDARARWRVPPRYVLIVGDATFDPRNFLGKGDFDYAPTKLIDTQEMETVSDDWMVDFNDDGVPEMALGRLPVRSKEEAAIIVTKTLAYAGVADRPRGGLFVTDKNGPEPELDFETASAASEAKVSDLMPIDRFRRSETGADTAALLAKLNQGPFLVNYLGHGSVEVWEGLLNSAQGKALTNAHTSLYVVMNCLNAFFHDLYTESLAEALLKAPQGGAVAVWASSTLAEYAPQPAFNQEFLARLSRISLGQTAMAAKSSITDLEARRTWMLFGDPTLFGTPGPAPDGGITEPDPTDGGVADAGMEAGAMEGGTIEAGTPDGGADALAPEADAGAPDAGTPDAVVMDASPTDASPMDAARADAKGDAPKVTAGGDGCGCSAGGSTPASASVVGLLLLACLTTRRRVARPVRHARRWPLALLALVLGTLAAPRAADAAYGYRKALTIDRTRIGAAGGATTLSGYPLLITMTDPDLRTRVPNMGHVESASGHDIIFTGADSTTCGGPATCTLAHEVERYVASTGEIIAWVRIPTLKTVTNTTNTLIYVMYGDSSVTTSQQNVNGTWDTNYKGVWHLQQSPGGTAPQMTDSTSTGAHGTATNGPTAASTAKVGAGVTLDGTDDYFDYTTSTAFDYLSTDSFTYSGWFRTSDPNGPIHSLRGNTSNGNPVIDIHVGYDGATSNPGKLMVLLRDNTGGTYGQVMGGTCDDNTWHQYAVTRNGSSITLYLDGVSQGSASAAGTGGAITTTLRNWGRDGNWVASGYGTADQRYLAASFDEFRVSKSLRAAEWIATDYNTQNVPASTFTASAEALASCGDGTKLMAEACDDGNFLNGDGCSGVCTIETGYSCAGSPSVCTTTCGDGFVAGTEACDDSGTMSGDGCSSTCTIETAYHCTGSPSACLFARFDYLKHITIDRTKVGAASSPTTLSNYPVLVSVTDPNLRTTANGGHMRNANAYDMVFRGFNAVCGGAITQCTLSHEIESYNPTTGALIAWVQVPSLNTQTATSNTTFQILYGNMAISTTSERRTATWESNFKAVWHLHQNTGGTAPQMSDATSNANDGTSIALTSVSAAYIGTGVSTDGSTSSMTFNNGTSLNSAAGGAFTYSAWIKVPVAEQFGAIVSSRSTVAGGAVVIDLMVGANGGASTNPGQLKALLRDDSNGTLAELTGAAVNDNNWHLVTFTRNNTTLELFLDKVSQGTASGAGVGGTYTTNLRDIGREGRWILDNHLPPASNAFLQATFDEVRESAVARDIHWITTDYNNQSSPSTFMSFGAETATNSSTSAMLAFFEASETCNGTALRWQTTYEVDTLGFNVFRDVGSRREQVNAQLIPASVLSGGSPRQYGLIDTGTYDPTRVYWLEIVHFTAKSSMYGPSLPERALACEAARRPTPTPLAPAPSTGATSDQPTLADGGCSIAGGGTTGLAWLAALLLLTRARSRSRSRSRSRKH